MARISQYPVDAVISDEDKLIGSDSDNLGSTKTFTVGALAAHIGEGATGPQGIQGIQGIQGEQGPAGVSEDEGTIALNSGINFDSSNTDYTEQPIIRKVDYFDRNMVINDPEDPDYDVTKPWSVADEANAGMTTNTIDWDYQSLLGEPTFATHEVRGVISDQGALNGKYIIGNISMVGGIGEPVWTIGYVDEGDDHGQGPYDLGAPQNMYKKGDGTNTNGLLLDDFKPILQLEPSGTIAAVRGENLTALNDPDKVSHNAGSMFEGFFNKDIKPVMRIQGLNDEILGDGLGGGMLQFGPGGNWEADFHIKRGTAAQIGVQVNNQNFINLVADPVWRRGMVLENGNGLYLIGEGNRVQEQFTATAAQTDFTIAQALSTDGGTTGFTVKEVYVNGRNIGGWSVSGQTLTYAAQDPFAGNGYDFVGGETVVIVMRDEKAGREISLKHQYGTEYDNNILFIDGGVVKVHDIIRASDGVSAFASGGGSVDPNMLIVDLTDADSADFTKPSVGFNTGTTNFPTGTQYGQTLTVTGNGDTQWQMTSGFENDQIYFRTGNPERTADPVGSWKDWVQLATRDWVISQGSQPDNLQREITQSETLTAAADKYTVFVNSATAITITVDTGLPDNFTCEFVNIGAGTVTIASGTATVNVNANKTGSLATGNEAKLRKVFASNDFWLTGDLDLAV